MAAVGLLPVARTALPVATAVLPPYRSRFSKHQFTQPQLLAVLCLMRYEDWTFRETAVRLREHRELRRVLPLQSVPDYTTLYRFLKRRDDKKIDPALGEAARHRGNTGAARAAGPVSPWTPPDWRQARSAPSWCGAGILTPGNRCPGGMGGNGW